MKKKAFCAEEKKAFWWSIIILKGGANLTLWYYWFVEFQEKGKLFSLILMNFRFSRETGSIVFNINRY